MEPHVLPVRTYLNVFAGLIVGLILTVAASYFNFGPFNVVVALAIGVCKALLVILFFMHVKYGTRLIWMWATVGFIWFAMLFTILTDYFTRGTVTGW